MFKIPRPISLSELLCMDLNLCTIIIFLNIIDVETYEIISYKKLNCYELLLMRARHVSAFRIFRQVRSAPTEQFRYTTISRKYSPPPPPVFVNIKQQQLTDHNHFTPLYLETCFFCCYILSTCRVLYQATLSQNVRSLSMHNQVHYKNMDTIFSRNYFSHLDLITKKCKMEWL